MKKLNAFLVKIGMPLNIINITIGLLIGIAHVYIPLPSIPGLILGIFMALSGSITIALSYYFTSKMASKSANAKNDSVVEEKRKHTLKSTIFMCIVIPMILLNAGACFFGMYTGMLLLAPALAAVMAFPPSGAVVLALAIILATTLTLGTLINSWLQAHNIWESFKQAVSKPTETPKEESTTVINETLEKQTYRQAYASLQHLDLAVNDEKMNEEMVKPDFKKVDDAPTMKPRMM